MKPSFLVMYSLFRQPQTCLNFVIVCWTEAHCPHHLQMKKQCEVQPDLQTAQAEPGPPQPQDLGRKAKSESTATSKDSLLLRLRKSFVSMALA